MPTERQQQCRTAGLKGAVHAELLRYAACGQARANPIKASLQGLGQGQTSKDLVAATGSKGLQGRSKEFST